MCLSNSEWFKLFLKLNLCILKYLNIVSILMGGKDKTIYVWSLNYVQITKIEISKLIKESLNPRIRSIDCSADSKHIVIGTFGSEIFKLKHTD
jgi:WD40 repeat protein